MRSSRPSSPCTKIVGLEGAGLFTSGMLLIGPKRWAQKDGTTKTDQDVAGAAWSQDRRALCYKGGQEREWVQVEADEEADEELYSALVQLQDDQHEIEKERQEIEAMLAENDRNFQHARRVVEAGVKDRGWGGGVAQRCAEAIQTHLHVRAA